MARLPIPGEDRGQWGDILNEFLSQSLDAEGILKPASVGSTQLKPGSVGTEKLADVSVTNEKIRNFGTANGVASLDSDGHVPEAQLPERLSASILSSDIQSAASSEAVKATGGMGTVGSGDGPVNWSEPIVALTKAAMDIAGGKTSIYWPWIVDTQGTLSGTPGRFMVFWSTNHDANTGGIVMAYANHPAGPWTAFGTVYVDSIEGNQTETPSVVLSDGHLMMFYQQRGAGTGTQSTLYATSTDGINWIRQGFAFQKPSAGLPNDGHMGYARVYKLSKYRWIAFTLFSGTDYSRQAIWHSRDGERWMLDRRLLVNNVDISGNNNLRLSMSPPLLYWRNQLWGGANIKSPSSGGAGASVNEFYMARLSEDMRSFVGEWIPSIVPNSIIEFEGVLYGYSVSSSGLVYRRQET